MCLAMLNTDLELAGGDRYGGSRREAVNHRMWDVVDQKPCVKNARTRRTDTVGTIPTRCRPNGT